MGLLRKLKSGTSHLKKRDAREEPEKDVPSADSRPNGTEKAERDPEVHQRGEHEREQRQQRFANEQEPEATQAAYGYLDDHAEANELERTRLAALSTEDIGRTVAVRARLQSSRNQSASLAFLILRLQTTTVQAVISFGAEVDKSGAEVSHSMLHFAQHIPRDSVVLVVGEVTKPQSADGRVHAVSQHDIEIHVRKLFVISESRMRPFDLTLPTQKEEPKADGASDDDGHPTVELHTRLANRAFDLRAPVNQAVFRVQAKLCSFFRRFLEDEGFLEIHSAKLQAAATESGASVFKVDYFGRTGFLAQSPQLAKQMAIAGDMERVFEVGPVFRAEPSNTVRHLTEYTGLDLEMAIDRDYGELRTLVDRLLKSVLGNLLDKCKEEIALIRTVYPSEDFLLPDETVVLDFEEGCRLLKEAGIDQDPYDDLSTPNEKALGKIVLEKYKTSYYILDRFPTSARPFYTMRDPDDPRRSRSFDIFWRGQEIISGGQRVHDPQQLVDNLVEAGIHPDTMKDYVDGFRCAATPHGGIGLGLERATMLFLALPNIRHCSLFPRDPASLRVPEVPPLIRAVEPKVKRSVFTTVDDPKRPAGDDDGHRLERNTAREDRFGMRED